MNSYKTCKRTCEPVSIYVHTYALYVYILCISIICAYMHMSICMCMCAGIYYMHVYMYVHVCIHTYVCVYTAYICMYVWICECMCVISHSLLVGPALRSSVHNYPTISLGYTPAGVYEKKGCSSDRARVGRVGGRNRAHMVGAGQWSIGAHMGNREEKYNM